MHKVIEQFVDLMDSNHVYAVGDEFPRRGHVVSEDRINELSGNNNKRKMPLIAKVEEAKPVKAVEISTVEAKDDVPAEAVEEAKPRSRKQKK